MYEVLDKDTIKSENLPYLSVAKRGYAPKGYLAKVIQYILYMPGNWLQMADYFCLCMMQAPLTMSTAWPATAHAGGPKRTCLSLSSSCACMQYK